MDLNNYFYIVTAAIFAYLLGSLPTAVWAGKILRGIDIREHGSGNAGATNAMRVLGPGIGVAVLLIDAAKGIAAVALAGYVGQAYFSDEVFVLFQLFFGAMAVLGHVFPVFASFRGGKGIATLVGVVFIMFPSAFLICLAVFLATFFATRYVSLGSLMAAVALPVVVIWIKDITLLPKVIFAISVAFFVPITHKNNIKRLLSGKENRISFRR